MSKIALATDSTAYLPQDYAGEHGIHVVPLRVNFDNESYKELDELTPDAFFQKVREGGDLPQTSQPPIGEFVELYEQLAKDGYTDVIVVTLSAKISGTYEAATSAGNMVEGLNVHTFNSAIACLPQGFYVMEAQRMLQESASVTDILTRLEAIRERGMTAYFMVDDLNHLHRGGRLSGAQAVVGSLLRMKPIITFQDEVIKPYEKIRTRKKALNRIKDLFRDDVATASHVRVAIIQANVNEAAEELADWMRTEFDHVEVYMSYFGPVIGTHVGEGTLGMGWYHV
ncbi:DegV family protein [Tuberibacillus sp. Marseille-P3662]|uniref:DegV family protein n=1 Tax=Tuberibacillus sp. Marseille-P3662 TaxID=1965358 RepID=UPI000A1CBBE1|nr:DegV family protein [Tuberibacillus sp. Marseille-P3662]